MLLIPTQQIELITLKRLNHSSPELDYIRQFNEYQLNSKNGLKD